MTQARSGTRRMTKPLPSASHLSKRQLEAVTCGDTQLKAIFDIRGPEALIDVILAPCPRKRGPVQPRIRRAPVSAPFRSCPSMEQRA